MSVDAEPTSRGAPSVEPSDRGQDSAARLPLDEPLGDEAEPAPEDGDGHRPSPPRRRGVGAGRTRSRRPGKRPRRHPVLHWFVIGGIVLASIANVAVFWTKWRLERTFGDIPELPIEEGVLDPPGRPGTTVPVASSAPAPTAPTVPGAPVTTAAPVAPTSTVAAFGSDAAYNVLMVGLDKRSDELCTDDRLNPDAICGENDGGSRTDTMMLVRMDPKTRQAAVLSIPRDTWVLNAGTGKQSKINAAYVRSPSALVRTVQQTFNVPVAHLVEVDFLGFARLVDAVGGVELCFDYPTRDLSTGLDQSAGCKLVDAEQAIAYVRSRHYEQERTTDIWTPQPGADIARIRRQQLFLTAAIKRAGAQAGNPLEFTRLLKAAQSAIKIDSGFSLQEFSRLANQFRTFDPATLETYIVPTRNARAAGQDVLLIEQAKAAPIVGRFGRRS